MFSILCQTIQQIERNKAKMEQDCHQELQDVLKKRNGKQAIMHKSIAMARRRVSRAKQLCVIQVEQDKDRVAITYHLLRPQQSK